MRKLMIALAAAAVAMTSMAQSSSSAITLLPAQYSLDPNPSNAHAGWYSMYVMTLDKALDVLDAGSYNEINVLLNGVGLSLLSSIKANADSIPCSGFWGYQCYQFEDNESHHLDNPTDLVCFWFCDNGTEQQYWLKLYEQKSNYNFGYVDYSAEGAGWQSMGGSPVPEPTSGLLLLLGMAGLALKRRRA